MTKTIVFVLVTALLLTSFGVIIFAQSDAEIRAQAERDGKADGSSDVNMFGCGMGGFFLGPFGWLHAVFAQRNLETERILMLQD